MLVRSRVTFVLSVIFAKIPSVTHLSVMGYHDASEKDIEYVTGSSE